MLKLAKAEIYRFFKSGVFSKILIALSVLFPLVTAAVAWEFDLHREGLDTFLLEAQMPLVMIVMLAFPTVFCVFVGTSYNSRLAYYEIMDGNKPLKIVIAKILSLGLFTSTILYIPFAALCGVIGAINGFGEMENPVLFFVITYVIFTHIVICSLLYSMFARNLILASFVPYIRFGIIDFLIAMFIEEYFISNGKEAPAILNAFLYNQMGKLNSGVYSNSFVVYTILSAVAEIAILSVIVIINYRKKNFK